MDIRLALFIPNDFKSVEPVSTSLFHKFMRRGKPILMITRMMLSSKKWLEPSYYPVNGMDSVLEWVKKESKN